MFRNLDAEQTRFNLNNQAMAEFLGYKDRKSYETKKANGTFTMVEAKKMAQRFNCSLDYLFETAADREGVQT